MDRDHSEEELARVARLSGLSLEGEEEALFLSDFARITAYMERISELDTSAVREEEETAGGSDGLQARRCPVVREDAVPIQECPNLRDDVARESGLSEVILAGAPDAQDGMFTVPKTVE